MKKTLRRLGACLLVFAAAAPACAGPARDALQAFLDDPRAVRGTFEQTVTDRQGRAAEEPSKGVFLFARPGKFRWETTAPYPQTIVSDGKTLRIWDPDLGQVTERSLTGALAGTPAGVLFGDGDPEKDYELSEDAPGGRLAWITARPRVKDSPFAALRLGFGENRLQAMELVDAFGQRTKLSFPQIERLGAVPADAFTLRIPEGADVLRDAAPGA